VRNTFVLVLVILALASCRSVEKSTITTIKDSVVVREFDVPVTIKEQTITQELSLDSLCAELENLKAELRERKQPTIRVINRETNNLKLEAQIDSLGRLLILSQRQQLDTLIQGQETIRTRTETTEKTVEKEPLSWWRLALVFGACLLIWEIIKRLASNLPFL
jgi:hypothetical protein